jgi:hypothetical protein
MMSTGIRMSRRGGRSPVLIVVASSSISTPAASVDAVHAVVLPQQLRVSEEAQDGCGLLTPTEARVGPEGRSRVLGTIGSRLLLIISG